MIPTTRTLGSAANSFAAAIISSSNFFLGIPEFSEFGRSQSRREFQGVLFDTGIFKFKPILVLWIVADISTSLNGFAEEASRPMSCIGRG